jgi:hypothetical protein
MDNWGWCSGNCGGAEGCYKEFIDSDRRYTDQCESKNPSRNYDPWIYYSNNVVVIPISE